MSDFDVLVDQLRAAWVDTQDQPDLVTAALDAEVEEFRLHRATIEQAKGVLMQLLSIDADQAFAVLSRYSQTHNVKLRVLAERLTSAAAERGTPSRDDPEGARHRAARTPGAARLTPPAHRSAADRAPGSQGDDHRPGGGVLQVRASRPTGARTASGGFSVKRKSAPGVANPARSWLMSRPVAPL